MTWSLLGERSNRECGLKREDAQECEKWRKLLWEAIGQPQRKWKNDRKTIVVVVVEIINICYRSEDIRFKLGE